MTPIRVPEAQAAILHHLTRQPSLRLPLADALHHRLAEAVAAPWPLPMWTAASMDGYAVHADDVRGARSDAPITLTLGGGGDAGDGDPPPLQRGTAWRVATGGRVPAGADTVIRQEDTQPNRQEARGEKQEATAQRHVSRVTFVHDRDVGRNVRPAGGDVAAGDIVLRAGTVVHPGVLAMLAALGASTPMVYRKPRVAILASGNEVASLDHMERVASGERIADVNGPMLGALVSAAGGVPVSLGLVGDSVVALQGAMDGAADCDLILTAGGVSVGEQDHVTAAMQATSARVVFRRVALRPGGPTTFAVLPQGTPWLALPGNPVSAFVTFHLFAAPAIRAMSGAEFPHASQQRARLGTSVTRDPNLDQYLRVSLTPAPDDGHPTVSVTGNQGSWVLSSIVAADGLALVEAGEGEITAGSEVGVVKLETGNR